MLTIEENTPWFRELFFNVLSYQGGSLYESELKPWIENARLAMAHAARFKTAERFDATSEGFLPPNWNLYALGRINDYLLLSFQGDERGSWAGPQISLDQYLSFFTEIGFTTAYSESFSSLHNEIVTVEQSRDRDEPITIRSTLWPGLKFGDMIFSRAGTGIRGGTANVVKQDDSYVEERTGASG